MRHDLVVQEGHKEADVSRMLKVVREGDDLGVELPSEFLAHLQVSEGGDLVATRTEAGIRLSRLVSPSIDEVDMESSGDARE